MTHRRHPRFTYPEGTRSPKAEININTEKGKLFRYVPCYMSLWFCFSTSSPARCDRDFLIQFMNIYKERADDLPFLDVIGLEPSDTSHTIS
ncbi:hypothetical protein BJV78DRAFT_1127219 [Lactifluus subvellereus]|nr:hypothetical protein BJV78DRAFT_1127219 [Lactifluus subvellereus]